MTCETYEELVAAHVDGVLPSSELQEVERHLASCQQCPQLFAAQSEFQTAFAARRLLVSAPIEINQRLQVALAAAAGLPVSPSVRPSGWTRLFTFFAQPRFALGAAAAAVLVVALLSHSFLFEPALAVFPQAVSSYQATITQQQPLDYVMADPQELERTLNLSGQLDFTTQVADLRSAGYRLRGGTIVQIRNRPTAIAVYDKGEDHIVCLRQGGKLLMLPPNSETVHGHYIYAHEGYTIMYSQFQQHYCLLISRLPREQFLRSLGLSPEV